jgi:hypothetical protein
MVFGPTGVLLFDVGTSADALRPSSAGASAQKAQPELLAAQCCLAGGALASGEDDVKQSDAIQWRPGNHPGPTAVAVVTCSPSRDCPDIS